MINKTYHPGQNNAAAHQRLRRKMKMRKWLNWGLAGLLGASALVIGVQSCSSNNAEAQPSPRTSAAEQNNATTTPIVYHNDTYNGFRIERTGQQYQLVVLADHLDRQTDAVHRFENRNAVDTWLEAVSDLEAYDLNRPTNNVDLEFTVTNNLGRVVPETSYGASRIEYLARLTKALANDGQDEISFRDADRLYAISGRGQRIAGYLDVKRGLGDQR